MWLAQGLNQGPVGPESKAQPQGQSAPQNVCDGVGGWLRFVTVALAGLFY